MKQYIVSYVNEDEPTNTRIMVVDDADISKIEESKKTTTFHFSDGTQQEVGEYIIIEGSLTKITRH